jgi:hypothetical protein
VDYKVGAALLKRQAEKLTAVIWPPYHKASEKTSLKQQKHEKP